MSCVSPRTATCIDLRFAPTQYDWVDFTERADGNLEDYAVDQGTNEMLEVGVQMMTPNSD